jgi:probable rRNA maturation factor
VDVDVRPGLARVAPGAAIARAVGRALAAAGPPGPASVGVTLSDDRELAELNAAHMGHKGPTDVLSFPLLPPAAYPVHEGQDPAVRSGTAGPEFALPPGRRVHLGDIVVSVERAVEQAERGRGGQTSDLSWTPAEELLLLVTHGTLHLCGWDHARPDEEAAMRALERRLLA